MDKLTERQLRLRIKKKKWRFPLFLLYIILSISLGVVCAKNFDKFNLFKIKTTTENKSLQVPDSKVSNANIENETTLKSDENPAVTKQKQSLEELKENMLRKYQRVGIDLSFYIKDLRTGEFAIYNNKKMNSASIIKLYIMLEAYSQDKLGNELTTENEEVVKKMITKSHNESANTLIDNYSISDINKTIQKLGFKDTELQRKMHDTWKGPPSGLNNFSSVMDTGRLLEQIYRGECISKTASRKMLGYLQLQERDYKIPKLIKEQRPSVKVANKTGELLQVENDAAIISGDKFDFIFCIMINDIPYDENDKKANEALKKQLQEDIATMSMELVEFFEKQTN